MGNKQMLDERVLQAAICARRALEEISDEQSKDVVYKFLCAAEQYAVQVESLNAKFIMHMRKTYDLQCAGKQKSLFEEYD